jgi:LmbE family N-acetylglucosaminyl deacetylase
MPFQYTQLDQLPAGYDLIVLSPHLDDAALSCGGAIARHVALGGRALVVNVCSGSPPPDAAFSPFAQFQHSRWGLPAAQAVASRLAEDAAALEILGADALQLGLLDAIYRMPFAYVDDATLFGEVAPDDALLDAVHPILAALAARYPDAVLLAPLGVGNHVDHQAVYLAARAIPAPAAVAFYEDLPYAAEPDAVTRRLETLDGYWRSADTLIRATLPRKLAAIEAYVSQIGALFGSSAAMTERIGGYSRSVGSGGEPGERLWMRG